MFLEHKTGEQFSSLKECLNRDKGDLSLLWVTPHDDDAILRAAMIIRAAISENLPVKIVVVTDGRMGYWDPSDRAAVIGRRHDEAVRSYGILGVPEEAVEFLEFPDGNTNRYIGRREATQEDDPQLVIKGFTGLENSLVHVFRRAKPSHIFTVADTDMHPDHNTIWRAVSVSRFHASGKIWQELGEPCPESELLTWATYPPFPKDAVDLTLQGDPNLFDLKCRAIEAFQSQVQIEDLVQDIRSNRPLELFRMYP